MPMRRTLANRSSPRASTSAITRVMIDPTVAQAMRISHANVDLAQWRANHATVASKSRLCRAL